MKLITKALEKSVPKLSAQDGKGLDEMVFHVKLFTPWSNWTWYIAEADFETGRCFGMVDGFEAELGYFDLGELSEIRGMGGLKIERDMHFKPTVRTDLRLQAQGA